MIKFLCLSFECGVLYFCGLLIRLDFFSEVTGRAKKAEAKFLRYELDWN